MIDSLSNKDFKKIGDRIRQNPNNVEKTDLDVLQELRTSYKDDLSSVFNILVSLTRKIDKRAIITYRVKRIESIISKLIRQPQMQVNRMADIAGCRCILQTNANVIRLCKELSSCIIVKNINDYISNPKPNGYSSLHLMVQSPSNPKHTIEIQLRTQTQHNWATLVEITDLILQTKIKEFENNEDLVLFHRLLAKDMNVLSSEEMRSILNIARRYSYFEKISAIFNNNYIEVRNSWNRSRTGRNNFFLLATGSDGKPSIQTFSTFDEAEKEYYALYNSNTDGKNIVLTHINNANFEQISMAYSNYFLTYNELFFTCYSIASKLTIEEYMGNQPYLFLKTYPFFWKFTKDILGTHLTDYIEFRTKGVKILSSKKKQEWMGSITKHMERTFKILSQTHSRTPYSWKRKRCSIIKWMCLHVPSNRQIKLLRNK